MSDSLDPLRLSGVLSELDVALAETLCRLGGEQRGAVRLATAFASRAVRLGNVCLDLARLVADGPPHEDGEATPAVALPGLGGVGGRPARQRAARDTERAAGARRRAPVVPAPLLAARGGARRRHRRAGGRAGGRHRRRPPARGTEPPVRCREEKPDAALQRVAAFTAVSRRFCVISGGPGTGKTYTVVRILALAIEQALAAGLTPPRIKLMAPTGKAAARLQESVRAGMESCRASRRCARRFPRRRRPSTAPSVRPGTDRRPSAAIAAIRCARTWWSWTKPRWWTSR